MADRHYAVITVFPADRAVAGALARPLQRALHDLQERRPEVFRNVAGTGLEVYADGNFSVSAVVYGRPNTVVKRARKVLQAGFAAIARDPTVCYDLGLSQDQVKRFYLTAEDVYYQEAQHLGAQECTEPDCAVHEDR